MSEPTKGPWKASPWKVSPCSSIVGSLVTSGGQNIAAVIPRLDKAETEANAALIASAPDLQARLSRYEAAMREALRLLGAPMFPSVGGNDVRDILRATLSDQPAVNSMAFTRGDGDRALDCLIKNTRTTPADQPAEEPAESKLETLLRMRHDLRQEHEKLFTHSWAICTDEQKSYYATCKDLSRVDAAILDAQPSTPSGEEGKRT